MATIESLKKSLLLHSPAEQMQMILAMRERRRNFREAIHQARLLKGQKKPKKTTAAKGTPEDVLSRLTPSLLAELKLQLGLTE